jgi:acyl-[acyl-carrier-protein]-phospholipid O-acyltransferase/long-chain-fatty-acid--[acyl-carrier-protein] ligase
MAKSDSQADKPDYAPSEGPSSSLRSVSFVALLFTQFLTAVNDNTFRWLAIGVGKDYVDPENVSNILMAGTASFVLPYLLLAAPAGYLADRFSKNRVILGCKIAEIVIMTLGIVAISLRSDPRLNVLLLFAAVALMGAQSALFSPSKMGSIPELLTSRKISAANGLFGLATVSATVIGMVLGSWLSDVTGFRGQTRWWLSAIVLQSIAVTGFLLSLMIRRLPIANAARRFPWDAFSQVVRDLRILGSNTALMRVALGVVFFWSVGALAQMNIDQFAFEGGAMNETDKIPLLVALIFGVGLGSVLAGILSGDHVELGILPLGAFGVAVFSMLLFSSADVILQPTAEWTAGLIWACALLLGLGTSAGLFSVPLESYMQHRSPIRQRGSILAATNFLVFGGVLLAALLFALLRYPTYEGSLTNIPSVASADLSKEDRQEIQRVCEEYRQDIAEQPSYSADQYLGQFPPEMHDVVLAELMWVELKERQNLSEYLDKYAFFARYTDSADKQLAKEVFDQVSDLPLLTARQIFLLSGIGTIPVFLYIVFLIPQSSVRFLAWLASHTAYRIRVFGRENLPQRGGTLLVSNHVSWLDGILLLLTTSRPVRILAFVGEMRGRVLHWLARLAGVILVEASPNKTKAALEEARSALRRGEVVGLFPEGGMTRTGLLQAFRPGLLKVHDGTDVPVIPVYLDELWGSIFSFHGGRFFWKRPRRWPYPIGIYFGDRVADPKDVQKVRRAVQDLGAKAVEQRSQNMTWVTTSFVRSCKQQRWRRKVADSTGAKLTGGALLMRSLILRRLLGREVLASDEKFVGVLLPPSAGSAAVNAALSLDGRVSVNLNYTVSQGVMDACIQQAGIRHVITSRKVLEKMDFEFDVDVVILEDLRDKLSFADKLISVAQTYLLPASMLTRSLKLQQAQGDDLLTVIFTSGSTGEPKGVMLTHGNVASNVQAVQELIRIGRDDVLMGILPFFHSFGYTITMWTVLSLDVKGVYHFNPLDARVVGKLCREHHGTILLATPTFLRSYIRRCEKDDFASLDVVVTGAERLPPDVADGFEERFGIRPLEGYGCTETSPLASVNIPPSRSLGHSQIDAKQGTVGRPIPGVSAKTIDSMTGEEKPVGEAGMLCIKGPNIMLGYLGRPDLTEKVINDGWYTTGDIALIDEDGFIKITGRESRFSKIGGEMVPHIQIEETLARIIGDQEGAPRVAVTAVEHPRKGERLIVVHAEIDQEPAELCRKLAEAGLPNIYIPTPDSFVQVESLPVLGTGKLDLRGIRQVAEHRFGESHE